MFAAIYYGKKDIRLEEVEIPEIGAGDILVKTKAAAICGTDLRIYNYGHKKLLEGEKRILGHELAGEVAEAGVKVEKIKKGMRVAVASNIGCGRCNFCQQGFYHLCPSYDALGLTLNGGFAEYFKVPERAVNQGIVFPIPENLPYEIAAINEPLACVYNGYKRCNIQPGDVVVIAGAGPIGMMHLLMARLAGARKIIVSEISEERLKIAKQLGSDVVINSNKKNLVKEVMRETNNKGADVIIIACPSRETQEIASEMAAVHGRVNFFGGLPKDKEIINFNSNLVHYKELIITGSHGSYNYHYGITLELLGSGRLDLSLLITNKFPLGKIKEAFQTAIAGTGMKTVICFS